MPQIYQKPPSFGEQFGTSLGSGIGAGLQYLAQQKLNELAYQPLLGKGAASFSRWSPEIQKMALQNPGILQHLLSEGEPEILQNLPQTPETFREGLNALAEQAGVPIEKLQESLKNYGLDASKIQERESQESAAMQQQQQAASKSQKAAQIADIFTSPQEKREREKLNLRRIQTYQPKFEKIEQEAKPAREIKDTAEKALALVKQRVAKTGLAGAFTPKYLQTPEGQVLTTYLQQLVLKNAQHGKGLPSVARLKLEEGAKAAIWQQPRAIERILEDTINNPEVIKEITRGNVAEQLQDKYGGNIPDDIFSQLNRETSRQLKSREQEQSSKSMKDIESKYPASKLEEGTVAANPNTGEDEFVVHNGRWERL